MKSVFVLKYGWTDDERVLTELHQSIDSAEKSGEAFLAAEKRFATAGTGAPAFYSIERYNFDVIISEVKI